MSYECAGCGGEIQPRAKGVLTQVKGWVEARDGGGVHHLIQREATGVYVHKACLEPTQGKQETLFA